MRFAVPLVIVVGWSFLVGSAFGALPAPNPYGAHVATTNPRTPEDERKGFHLPPGFDIELVAAEPQIRKPINMNFDAKGRLWVTQSVEYPFPAADNAKKRDRVSILEDFQENGRAGKVSVFADGLNIPIGVLPLSPTVALVYSIPYIYRVTDTDGDGKADKREVLYGTYGFKDTHGMTGEFTWGFDGWVYACHGFSNTSVVKGSDGQAITMQSGNTYRMRPDGSHVEYWSHGQVNPFGLCFDPLGNLYSCDCETRPVYVLLRGAYYPSFGKPHDGLGFGPEMINHGHGSTAIAGIAYYAAEQFPPEYRDTVFIGNVVTDRINHDRLERHGSTLNAVQQKDFLTSDDPWFRPVDIKLGPDGALYVADWYNRIIGHYEVPLTHPGRDHDHGRIWRIVYRGPDGKDRLAQPRADWTQATVEELIQDLGYPNLTVRMMATNELVEHWGKAAVSAINQLLQGKATPFQRVHGLWVMERVGGLTDQLLEKAIEDKEAMVRTHAMRILAERRELSPPMHQHLVDGLNDPDGFVRRTAADALGRHPTPDNLRPLLDLRHAVPADDTHLLHVVRMALRDQLLLVQDWARLVKSSWSDRDLRAVADVAPGVPNAAAAAFLMDHLEHVAEGGDNQARYVNHIARYGAEDLAPRLLHFVEQDREGVQQQVALLKAMLQGTQARGAALNAPARNWAKGLARRLLDSDKPNDVLAGIDLCGSLKIAGAQELLEKVAQDQKQPEASRGAALSALVTIDPGKQVSLLAKLLDDAGESFAIRDKAARALAGINQPPAREALLKSLPLVPEKLALPVATGLSSSRVGAEKLLEAVAAGKASARLLLEPPVVLNLERSRPDHLQERLAKLTQGLPPADARLQELIHRRRDRFAKAKTDPALGATVFEKHCAICHQIGNKGARVGPNLDGIGIRGTDRLLEDILDPNRNVDQEFRLTTLNLTNGQIVSGLVLREEGEVLVVADSQGKEVRVPKKQVEERAVSPLSPMPANLGDQIPEGDFYNLLAYLLTQQPSKDQTPKPKR